MSVEPLYAGAIQAADVNLLVIQLNVPSVRNAERFISAMKRMGVNSDSFKVVVNRFEKKSSDITPDDASKALGLPISWMIPNDFRSAIAAINYGQPLVLRSPKAEISTSYGRLVQMLNGHVGRENG
jgi:pilus assembly protein CpaE